MHRTLTVFIVLSLQTSGTGYAQDLLLQNARIADQEAEKTIEGSIIIRNGKIAGVWGSAPRDFDGEVIDLTDKWIIPSLNDMHVHSFGNMAPGGKGQFLMTAGSAKMMLYAGVTGFLDLFAAEDYILDLRDKQRAEGLPGADIYCAGPCFTCTDGHCSEYGIPTRIINTPAEARTQVAEVAMKKPDVIKLVYDHAFARMPTVDKATMEALVETANEHQIKTVIHIGTWQDAREAILAGATAITHTYQEAIPDDLVQLMRGKGVYVIPTLTVQTGMVYLVEEPETLEGNLLNRVVDAKVIDAYRDSSSFDARSKRWMKWQKSGRAESLRNVKRMADAGVKILTGTDAGNLGTFQGYSVHTELSLLVQAGLTPWQALAASTTAVGDFLGKEFGVKEGAEANLLVLEASPIENIRNTEKIAMVIHHGKIVNRDQLLTASNQ
ncbi:amidohydrolase family protein [bacterium]|nr:amidohydrolase family protein [bacterium]